jgi:hypothetical protein
LAVISLIIRHKAAGPVGLGRRFHFLPSLLRGCRSDLAFTLFASRLGVSFCNDLRFDVLVARAARSMKRV